jgi:polysaccharide deacetylase family protein (PEP-CTERM system associated)
MSRLTTHSAFPSYTAQAATPSGVRSAVCHHFTIDVEEYFQVSALEPYVARHRWDSMETRVERAMDRLLSLMDEGGVRSTCFVLSWIAERHPNMVRSLADAGHEVASHGTDHRRVTQLSPAEFRDSVRRSKDVLEDLLGRPVLGYRAPSFSIVVGREWALDILVEEGYEYDSSLFPIRRPGGYGYAQGKPHPHWLIRPSGRLLEIPPTTLELFGARLPAAGGAYFRILPSAFTYSALQAFERRGIAGTFYIHPWELDAGQPILTTSAVTRFRHYRGLERTEGRLRKLMCAFRFQPVSATLAALRTEERATLGVAVS